MDTTAALAVLGLDATADLAAVKRRFRALAHDLHPDLGGDPRSFHELQVAYRFLSGELAHDSRAPRPRVARGRPSRQRPRPPDTSAPAARPLAELSDVELGRLLSDRSRGLDEELLARVLLRGPVGSGTHRLQARAPGVRGRRLGDLLDSGMSSGLMFAEGRAGMLIELSTRGRRMRRAVTALDPTALSCASWMRRRGDAVTVMAAELGTSARSESGARLAAAATVELLDALSWPLAHWRLDRAGPSSRP